MRKQTPIANDGADCSRRRAAAAVQPQPCSRSRAGAAVQKKAGGPANFPSLGSIFNFLPLSQTFLDKPILYIGRHSPLNSKKAGDPAIVFKSR